MSWIQTYSGRKFYPLSPRPEDVELDDIAHALAFKCRFNGHCKKFYSVAEHCVRMCRADLPGTKIGRLFHDAAEAYIADVSKPIKGLLIGFDNIEHNILIAIAHRFQINCEQMESEGVARADAIMLATEARDLMSPVHPDWPNLTEPLTEIIEPWQPEVAEKMFKSQAHMLLG